MELQVINLELYLRKVELTQSEKYLVTPRQILFVLSEILDFGYCRWTTNEAVKSMNECFGDMKRKALLPYWKQSLFVFLVETGESRSPCSIRQNCRLPNFRALYNTGRGLPGSPAPTTPSSSSSSMRRAARG